MEFYVYSTCLSLLSAAANAFYQHSMIFEISFFFFAPVVSRGSMQQRQHEMKFSKILKNKVYTQTFKDSKYLRR